MAKLYFRHGTVYSAKTLNLLAVAHNYKVQNKQVLLLKPALDTRFGAKPIKSRAGLSNEADLQITPEMDLLEELNKRSEGLYCVLVDEAQFLSVSNIEDLRDFATNGVPVICYGLRTDFTTSLFPASKRLLELSDTVEEIKTTCWFCNRKAICNLRLIDGVAVTSGPTVMLGGEESYRPTCYEHYSAQTKNSE